MCRGGGGRGAEEVRFSAESSQQDGRGYEGTDGRLVVSEAGGRRMLRGVRRSLVEQIGMRAGVGGEVANNGEEEPVI